MSERESDRAKRALIELMEEGPDKCTYCGRDFRDSDRTYGGLVASGHVHLVGDCCIGKLRQVMLGGIFLAPRDLSAVAFDRFRR